ncbi:MAG TPA: hypothetical protein VFW54_09310, partial [Propionibacteriaceae bacterium]|nr:hypothetical protein [Propionibacteriaceae bacterium]
MRRTAGCGTPRRPKTSDLGTLSSPHCALSPEQAADPGAPSSTKHLQGTQAAAHAAWQGRREITKSDIRAAARLALPHRRRRNPFDAPGLDEDLLDR